MRVESLLGVVAHLPGECPHCYGTGEMVRVEMEAESVFACGVCGGSGRVWPDVLNMNREPPYWMTRMIGHSMPPKIELVVPSEWDDRARRDADLIRDVTGHRIGTNSVDPPFGDGPQLHSVHAIDAGLLFAVGQVLASATVTCHPARIKDTSYAPEQLPCCSSRWAGYDAEVDRSDGTLNNLWHWTLENVTPA